MNVNFNCKQMSSNYTASNDLEKEILSRNCAQIAAQIKAQYPGRSSGRFNAIRDSVTNYLMSVGSPAAMEMLRHFEKNGFPA